MKLESEIQKEILHFLNSQSDFFAWKNSSTGIYSQGRFRKKAGFDIRGTSDILGIHFPSGRLVAIEVKSEKGKCSLEQFAFLSKITNMGGSAIWVKSLEEAKEFVTLVRGK